MLGGFPVVYGINPYASETTPSHVLGTIGVTPDGRKYRYVRNNASTAAVAGELQQSPAQTTDSQSLITAAGSIGATSVTTTDTTTVTADEFADGYLVTTGEGGTGNGFAYKIKGHAAATAAVVTINLYEPLEVAITAATQIDLVHNPYNRIIQNPTTASGSPVGVAVIALAVDVYGWVQSGGPGVVLADASGAITVGAKVTASNQTAGACEDGDTDTQAVVAVALTGIAQGEYGAANLLLD